MSIFLTLFIILLILIIVLVFDDTFNDNFLTLFLVVLIGKRRIVKKSLLEKATQIVLYDEKIKDFIINNYHKETIDHFEYALVILRAEGFLTDEQHQHKLTLIVKSLEERLSNRKKAAMKFANNLVKKLDGLIDSLEKEIKKEEKDV
jgi:hypothetical protein